MIVIGVSKGSNKVHKGAQIADEGYPHKLYKPVCGVILKTFFVADGEESDLTCRFCKLGKRLGDVMD